MLSDKQRKRAFSAIIVTQCLGMLVIALFQNGFYLNYFTKLGISSAAIAMLFSLPPLLGAFLIIPFAFYSDRMGKKRLALIGQILFIGSMLVVIGAGRGRPEWAMPLVVISLVVYCAAGSLQAASWFALLSPIIPSEIRGRFFGRLRMTFTVACILFTWVTTLVLKASDSMLSFQLLLGGVTLAAVLRYFTFSRIPELENEQGEANHNSNLKQALLVVLKEPGFIQFNGYVFLITLFSAGVPIVFGLMQKDVFGFDPARIMRMGNLYLAGTMVGCWIGGRAVDRFGTRAVFLNTHIFYALVMLTMLARYWVPWPLPVHAGLCSFLFSMVGGTAGVAVTSELLALIPPVNKSLFTAVNQALFSLALALPGMFVSRTISWNILSAEWQMLGQTYSIYDSLLLGFATMILLMLATIGLVPRIVRDAQLMPGGGYPRI